MLLHRSLVFWGGFVVFAFLVWTWVDSTRRATILSLNLLGPENHFQLDVARGSVGVTIGAGDPMSKRRMEVEHVPMAFWTREKGPHFWGPPPGWGRMAAFGFNYGHVPHWLLVACLLPPWLGVSVWRARRMGRGN